jgi:tetratricopeptide (TPR) repeat protein
MKKLIAKIKRFAKSQDPNSIRTALDELFFVVEKLEENKSYDKIITLLSPLLDDPYIIAYDFWVLMKFAEALYETRQYAPALEVAKKFIAIAPDDPRCKLLYGSVLRSNRLPQEALVQFMEVVEAPISKIIGDKKGANSEFEALFLKNDARYLAALTYFETNALDKSEELYTLHLEHRRKGLPAMVSIKQVRNELADVILLKNYQTRT